MTLVATDAKQIIRLARLGNVAQSHGWNLLATNGALIVIPNLGLKREPTGIVMTAVIKK